MYKLQHKKRVLKSIEFYSEIIYINCHVTQTFTQSSNNTIHSKQQTTKLETIKEQITRLFFYVLLTVHLSTSLDNDQLDTHLLHFTIRPLHSSTRFKHYMFIIRRLNCIYAASGIVLSVSGRPVHRLRENSYICIFIVL